MHSDPSCTLTGIRIIASLLCILEMSRRHKPWITLTSAYMIHMWFEALHVLIKLLIIFSHIPWTNHKCYIITNLTSLKRFSLYEAAIIHTALYNMYNCMDKLKICIIFSFQNYSEINFILLQWILIWNETQFWHVTRLCILSLAWYNI